MASRIFALLPLACLALLLVTGCESKKKSLPTSDISLHGRDGGVAFTSCATPNEGCACDTEGQQIGCGSVDRRSGDYVACSKGTRTCTSGHWSACKGDSIVEMRTAPSQRLLDLGNSTPCTDNPCDPYCNNAVDDPNGVPEDGGFTLVDGGLVLNPETLQIGHAAVCSDITVSPTTATINVTNINTSGLGYTITPPTLQLTATEVPAGCVSPLNAVWSLDRLDLATISSTGLVTLASPIAANMTATAYAGAFVKPVAISVTVNTLDTSAVPPANVDALVTAFAAAPVGTDPMTVLYPYASTVFPLGLSAPVVQWSTGGTAAGAVKIGLIYPAVGTPIFKWEQIIGETTPPRYQIPQKIWELFERSAKGQDAAYTVQRITGAPGLVRPAVVRPIHFATAPLKGRIVYTEYGRGDGHAYIRTVDPSGTATPVNVFPGNQAGTLNTRCPVCHTVAANGTIFATSNGIWSGNGGISTIDPTSGAFTHIPNSDFDSATYAAGTTGSGTGNPDGWRGFSWSPITPDGQIALTGNSFWGNTKGNIPTWPTTTNSSNYINGAANGNGTMQISPSMTSGGNGIGLRAEYYNNATFTGTAWVRTDPHPYFDWGATAPGGPVTNGNSYSVRWTGLIQPYFTENVTFTINTTADVSLVVNGTTVIAHNAAAPGANVARTGTIALTAGQRYPITVEFIKSGGGNGQIELRWAGTASAWQGGFSQTVPQSQLYNSATDQQYGLLVSYYNNATETAPAQFTRIEPELASNWGAASPATTITSADAFSSSWDGQVEAPYTGSYQFRIRGETGDSVAATVNGVAVIPLTVLPAGAVAGFTTTGSTAWSAGVDLTAGTKYTIHVDHREAGGNASLGVDWQILPPGGGVTAIYCATGGTGQTSAQLIAANLCSNSGNAPVIVTNAQSPTLTPTLPGTGVTANVPQINFDWGTAGPLGTSTGFLSRFTFTLYPQQTGYYTFYTTRNDGTRLYWPFTVNAMTEVPTASPTGAYSFVSGATSNLWADAAANVTAAISTPVLLTAGSTYNMTLLHYYNPASAGPTAAVSLLWSATSDLAGTVPMIASGATPQVIPSTFFAQPAILPAEQIPSDRLFPPVGYTAANGWRATYYNSRNWNDPTPVNASITDQIQGNGAAFTRVEATVNNDWVATRPQYSRVAADDNFSARYVGTLTVPCTGRYVFQLDESGTGNTDAAALWIDNQRIINSNFQATMDGVIDLVNATTHDIKVEYSEADGNAKVRLLWDPPAACETQAGAYVVPTGQLTPTGGGGASVVVRAGGDNTNGGGYSVWQLPQAVGQVPTDITGQSAGRWGLAGTTMLVPSFSPDGTRLVFVNGDSSNGSGWRKGISTFNFDRVNKYFSNKRLIVNTWPSGNAVKWPAFETDSHSVIYQASTPVETDNNDGNTSYGGVTPSNYFQVPGKLFSVDTTAGAPVGVELVNINQGEPVTPRVLDQNKSYQPTMLPVSAAGYRWVVFTSIRPYGNTVNTGGTEQSYANPAAYTPMTDKANHQSMLWVSAIDDTPSGATDRSHPAFFLPNQNYDANPANGYVNERGFWALSACHPVGNAAASTCDVNEDCCGGSGPTPTAICKVDTPITYPATSHCTTKPPANTCAPLGGACVVNADCCINDGLVCGGGTCQKPPPIDVQAYQPVNFERIYQGDCPADSSPVWHFFDWQASAPPTGSYIEFYAQTAANQADFVTIPPAPTPVTDPNVVYLGAAEPGDPAGWIGQDVAAKLAAKGLTNQYYLKITMRFSPNTENTASPVLTNWRQAHSCNPNQ